MEAKRQLRVLLVDDDAPTRTLVETLLGDEGIAVESVADAATVIEVIGERPPDVVLLDIMMPGTSGYDLMTQIRDCADVPIVLLSARGGEADRAIGLRLGADDYVVKPFGNVELVERIRAIADRTIKRD